MLTHCEAFGVTSCVLFSVKRDLAPASGPCPTPQGERGPHISPAPGEAQQGARSRRQSRCQPSLAPCPSDTKAQLEAWHIMDKHSLTAGTAQERLSSTAGCLQVPLQQQLLHLTVNRDSPTMVQARGFARIHSPLSLQEGRGCKPRLWLGKWSHNTSTVSLARAGAKQEFQIS